MRGLLVLAKRSAQSFGTDKCATLAASIAYYTIFALFPMALFGVAVLSFFMGDGAARQHVVDGITKVIPLGDTGSQALAKTLAGANHAKGWLSLIGLVTAAWGASGLFGAIRSALDSVWDVDRPLPMLRAKLRDLTLFLGFGGLLGVAIASTGVLQGARTAGSGVLGPLTQAAAPVFVLLLVAVPLAITVLAFLFLYRLAPHARLGWGDVWPAALLAALFFQFGTSLLSFYIAHLGNFNALAGSLGAAILLLVFVYYAAQVILFAAEVAKHRMLVRAGAVPATDPKVVAPTVPLREKLQGLLVRLWVVEERHHEQDLPYQPARLDPVRNAPTNTKEEVLFHQQQAQAQAEHDAQGGARDGGNAPAEEALAIYRPAKSAAGNDDTTVTAGELFPPAEPGPAVPSAR